MAETTVVIDQEQQFSVSMAESSLVVASSTPTAVVNSLDEIGDVDTVTEGKINGSVLVYKTTTNKWTSTTQLDAQNMEGGFF